MGGEVGATDQVFSAQRRAMVDGQIRTFDVTDARVVRAFDLTPRERFVPQEMRALSYSDALLTLKSPGTGRLVRTMMQPMHLARLLQGVDPAPDAHVLVVGGAAGYAAAVLLELVGSVVTLESDPGLTALAAEGLEAAGGRAEAATGPLDAGWADRAPYDHVLVLGGVEAGLDGLFAQLKPAGTLAAVASSAEANGRRTGRATVYTRANGDVSARSLFDVTLPVLPEFKASAGFVF